MDLFQPQNDAPLQDEPGIRIGTSGYSFQDWRGVFYPSDLPNARMLDLYMLHFRTVEINATYYGMPRPSVMAGMARKAPAGFDFMVKVPASFTHKREDLNADRDQFLRCIQPLVAAEKLSGVLAQFPFGFRFGVNQLEYLQIIRDVVAPIPLFVEFRHESWMNRPMHDRLKEWGIGYVSVDEPSLPGLVPPHAFATSNIAYVRLHGRNADQWWHGGALRYDYRYTEKELQEWGAKVDRLSQKADTTYVFFNNCHQGHAVMNARDFRRIIRSLKRVSRDS
jgi:uncharacterized protein YecE (DUF72 family)